MKIKWWHFVLVAFAVLAVMCTYYFLVYKFAGDMQSRGQFGDTFGAISSLFTALGFGALLLTIWQQNHERKLREVESEKHLDLLNKNAEAMTKSSEALTKQLQVMTISTKLAALPNLIDSTANELQTRYNEHLKDFTLLRTKDMSVAMIERIILNAKATLSEADQVKKELSVRGAVDVVNNQGWSVLIASDRRTFSKFIEELERLQKYKSDAVRLYDLVG